MCDHQKKKKGRENHHYYTVQTRPVNQYIYLHTVALQFSLSLFLVLVFDSHPLSSFCPHVLSIRTHTLLL